MATLRLEHENQLQKTLSDLEKERNQVKNQLLLQEKENELSLTSVKQNYEAQLKEANEEIERYKNFKAQQSTKAIGESLEKYAENEFNKIRSFAFPNAYFERTTRFLNVALKVTLFSVILMKMGWNSFPSCLR